MNTSPENMAASVRARLLNRARLQGEDYNYLLIRYFHERALYRLSRSPHADDFVLKGASLFVIWQGTPHRATKDLDLLGRGVPDPERLRTVFREILTTDVVEDGVIFDVDGITARAVREDAVYDGIRVSVGASLGSATTRIQIDVGFGDSATPEPAVVQYPALLDLPAPTIRAYRPETVVAEKLEAMVVLGMNSSRMKDYYDLSVLLNDHDFDPRVLAATIRATFSRRETSLPSDVPTGLSDEFCADVDKQIQWKAFLRRSLPNLNLGLEDVVVSIRRELEPVWARLSTKGSR